jgi:hypothetical protein
MYFFNTSSSVVSLEMMEFNSSTLRCLFSKQLKTTINVWYLDHIILDCFGSVWGYFGNGHIYRCPNLSVETVSSTLNFSGEQAINNVVLQFPPNDSRSKYVNSVSVLALAIHQE